MIPGNINNNIWGLAWHYSGIKGPLHYLFHTSLVARVEETRAMNFKILITGFPWKKEKWLIPYAIFQERMKPGSF